MLGYGLGNLMASIKVKYRPTPEKGAYPTYAKRIFPLWEKVGKNESATKDYCYVTG
jgi:hypothetical protein